MVVPQGTASSQKARCARGWGDHTSVQQLWAQATDAWSCAHVAACLPTGVLPLRRSLLVEVDVLVVPG